MAKRLPISVSGAPRLAEALELSHNPCTRNAMDCCPLLLSFRVERLRIEGSCQVLFPKELAPVKVLVILHAASEGPGTLGDFLEAHGAGVQEARLHGGDRLPAEPGKFDAVISMGGPMNVYEEDTYPFLREETALLREALRRKTPVLGICLGAQMIAKAAGARVVKSPAKEVGWSRIQLTPEGERDPWLAGLPRELEVFQWHEDMFEIPREGTLLAGSLACPHQALRCGSALGLQFHVEVTEGMLSEWFRGQPQEEAILRRHREIEPTLRAQAERLYGNFLGPLLQD